MWLARQIVSYEICLCQGTFDQMLTVLVLMSIISGVRVVLMALLKIAYLVWGR